VKPRLLDLFCGAGGAAMGYHRAGFEVVGVDINPQPHYPFEFIRADALDYLWAEQRLIELQGHGIVPFDAIHASPPCQAYTKKVSTWGRARTHWIDHPDLLAPTRDALDALGLPYVIENVEGAPLNGSLLLCGSMFGLRIRKHRIFEAGRWPMPFFSPASCDHRDIYNPWRGAGRTGDKLRDAQGTPWIPMGGGASRKVGVTGDLFNAIPPAYTEWIGSHLVETLRVAA
jgi:DNA (cytosine-5)-methyltransferase 1